MQIIERDPDKGYVDNLLWVPKKHINVEGTKKALTFTFVEQQNVTVLSLWKETANHLLLPREFWQAAKLPFPIVDVRPKSYKKVRIPSNITLDAKSPNETTQRDALQALLNAQGGILQLACGKGKTVVALELASRMSVPTLVIVDNTHLLGQWRAAILGDGKERKPLLGLTADEVGLIQGDKFDWKKPIVIATYQTLANLAATFPEEIRRWFGLIIWDEGHHMAAPTFSRTADLFYGYRLALTATPTRDDGLHVIYDFHLGKIIFKDLRQELRPRIYFMWTGLEVDLQNPKVREAACDKNGELHLSKLSTYFGQWPERIKLIIDEVDKAIKAGRKIFVLSNSVAELINLYATWTNYSGLYTDIEAPSSKDVGETVPGETLEPRELRRIYMTLKPIRIQLQDPALNPLKRQNLTIRKAELEHALKMHEVAQKIERELNKRRAAFLKEVLLHAKTSNAGLMIHKVKPDVRAEMLSSKQVVFAVSKYGREGLDDDKIDTILVCEPFSSRNTLQQVLGRALRKRVGKKAPVAIFLEDNIGPMMGMCQKLRRALREWPVEENGPYEYTMLGHPVTKRGQKWQMKWTAAGQS